MFGVTVFHRKYNGTVGVVFNLIFQFVRRNYFILLSVFRTNGNLLLQLYRLRPICI